MTKVPQSANISLEPTGAALSVPGVCRELVWPWLRCWYASSACGSLPRWPLSTFSMRNNIFGVATSLLLLFGCSRAPNDAEIQRLLVGTWRMDQDPSMTVQHRPDGSLMLQLDRGASNVVVEGTWQVKAGFVIATMTNAPSWYGPQDPVERYKAESNKVVSIDEHTMTLLSSQDGTTRLTAHRQ